MRPDAPPPSNGAADAHRNVPDARPPESQVTGGTLPAPVPAAGVGPSPAASRRRVGALARTTSLVTLAVLSSRFLGFLRDTVLSDRFGAAHMADAYVIGATVPLILFGVIGQALPTVLIPQYTRTLQAKGEAAAAEFANNINTVLTAAALVLMAAMWFLAPEVVDVVAPGIRAQSASEAAMAATLVRIMVPIVVFYIWAAVMQGILNVQGHFLAPAAMGVPQNLVIIAAIFGGSALWGQNGIVIVAWGAMVGTAFTFLIQWPPLRRTHFRFRLRLNLHDPTLVRTVHLAGPVVVASLFSQLGVTVDRALASTLPPGAIAAVYYATRLQQFTYAAVGLAISTVLFPQLSKHAGSGDMDRFKQVLMQGLRLISFVALPVMVAVLAFHTGIVRVIFQHGQFTRTDTERVVEALVYFTPGIVTYAWMDYMMRGYFALQDTRTPMIAGILSVSLNIAGDFILIHYLYQGGLTLATSIAWGCAATFLLLRLRPRIGRVNGRETAIALTKMLVAAGLAVGPAYALFVLWVDRFAGQRFLFDALGLVGAALIALALYLAVLALMRVPELTYALDLASGLLRRVGLGAH